MVQVVFVHGALVYDGAWWWHLVADLVREATGVSSRAVALPSCGEPREGASAAAVGAGPGGLAEDAAALRRVLDEVGSAVVVGHSYGGTVIAEGADHPAAARLLYLTSYLPDVGQSQADIVGAEPEPVSTAVDPASGTLGLDGYDPSSFGARFWHDVTDHSVRDAAWDRLTPQGIGAFTTPTTTAAWQGRESTYLICAEDRSTSPELQRRHAERASQVVELPTSHHPFLSRPDLVAEQVRGILASL